MVDLVDWPVEAVVDVDDVPALLSLLAEGRLDQYPTMTWRGVANIQWPLDSGLARRVVRSACGGERSSMTEAHVATAEAKLLRDARRLQLDQGVHGPLSDLELLARLQHQGAATRLVDVTTNALVAAWFAVEDTSQDAEDGVIFGIDMTDSELPEDRQSLPIDQVLEGDYVWLWRSPPVDFRIRAQQGAFLFSAVPGPAVRADRSLTSLALEVTPFRASRLFAPRPGSGRYPKSPVVIFRVPARIKVRLRQFLAGRLGYTAEVMYPDLAGFARARRA